MKASFLAALSSVLLLTISSWSMALDDTALDDIDQLLASEVSPALPEAASAEQPTLDALTGDDLGSGDVASAVQPSWQTVLSVPVTSEEESTVAEKPAEATEGLNMVPEPSAVALALLALGYFFVFGRRRQLV
jgi:hypothetical protein